MKKELNYHFKIFITSVFALIIRDIQKKYIKEVNSSRAYSFLWIFVEPIFHIVIWITLVKYVRGMQVGMEGMSLEFFIAIGACIFIMFRTILSGSTNAFVSNKSYYIFRQIKPLDPIIAKMICEYLNMVLIFFLIVTILKWFNQTIYFHDAYALFIASIAFSFFLTGLSIIFAVIGFFFTFFKLLVTAVMRFAYLFSGIFFNAAALPGEFRHMLLYNPVFQFIEITRESFQPNFHFVAYASCTYLIKIAFITFSVALILYGLTRKQIMTNIEQR